VPTVSFFYASEVRGTQLSYTLITPTTSPAPVVQQLRRRSLELQVRIPGFESHQGKSFFFGPAQLIYYSRPPPVPHLAPRMEFEPRYSDLELHIDTGFGSKYSQRQTPCATPAPHATPMSATTAAPQFVTMQKVKSKPKRFTFTNV